MGKKGIKSELLKEHSLWTSLSTDPKFENAALLIITHCYLYKIYKLQQFYGWYLIANN